jgi:Flp pilus assembly protein TadB
VAVIVLAALAGAALAGGLALLVRELTRREPAPGTPAWRMPGAAGRRTRTAGLGGRDQPASGVQRRLLVAVPAALAVLATTRWPVAGLAAAAAVLFLPRITLAGGERQRTELLEGLEQWIRRLADMLTASRGLEDAIGVSARTAPPAVAGPVTALAARIGSPAGAEAALRAFAAQIDDPAGDRIAAALIIATGRRGGAASDVLRTLARLLSRDVAARREIEAERAQHRATVRWITVFLAGFTVFAVLNRAYSAPFGTLAGQLTLAAVAVLYAAGLTWLHRLGTSSAPGRFLDEPAAAGAGSARQAHATGRLR